MSMGINMVNMAKMLKCANADDVVTLKVGDENEWGDGVVRFLPFFFGRGRLGRSRRRRLRRAGVVAGAAARGAESRAVTWAPSPGREPARRPNPSLPPPAPQAEDGGDTVTFMFESPKQERISDFELKLMDIDSEQVGSG
jgi:hypothetical protein